MFTNKPFIVAELSASHLGDYSRAFQLIDAAKFAGADAIKLQTYVPDEIAADVMIHKGPWAGRSYHDLYREGATPWEWHEALFTYAKGLGLVAFSTPFSASAVERLESINCPIYKIASPEITHLSLIAAAARTGKPLIISTGMASLDEITHAYEEATKNGATEIIFTHCVSAYPAKGSDFNLCTLGALRRLGFRVGLSDHSLGPMAAVIATALGAEVIEKHLTLLRADGGPDAAFSAEPGEFGSLVHGCRNAVATIGDTPFKKCHAEQESLQYRRSVWVVKGVKQGEVFKPEHLAILRPNYGVKPSSMGWILGKPATREIRAQTPFSWDFIA